ncbi:hypothetical protein ACFVT9_00825 [Kitasatospora cineracea]|uniref:hypothetical protein n=1 Tax=Kitasatospora cineracea TaxID=88074 RepID=UPI0036D82BE7
MRVADFASWEREFPLRYLLVRDVGNEQDWQAVELLARCADAEGLYLPREYSDRTVLVLEGCPADSPLAVTAAGPGGRQLGDLELEVLGRNGDWPPHVFELIGVSVVAVRPTAGAPGLVDLVLGTGLRDDWEYGRPRPPAQPYFEVRSKDRRIIAPLTHCGSIGGLYGRYPLPRPVQLIGCEPSRALLDGLAASGGRNDGWGQLVGLDRFGGVLRTENFPLPITDARPSVLGGALLDLTFEDGSPDRPTPDCRRVRELWFEGPPSEPGGWVGFDTPGRDEWLALCRPTLLSASPRGGGEHHLDGRYATDVPGLHLALGEALLGPGMSLGLDLYWLRERLDGDAPRTLVWHDAGTARRSLAPHVVRSDPAHSYFDAVLEVLAERGVTVVLD